MKLVQYMLNSKEVWDDEYVASTTTTGKQTKAQWAIGSPTLELLCKAYDKKNNLTGNNSHFSKISVNSAGYNDAGFTSSVKLLNFGTVFNHSDYWIASPSDNGTGRVRFVTSNSGTVNGNSSNLTLGFRPVVLLSGVKIALDEEAGIYKIQ